MTNETNERPQKPRKPRTITVVMQSDGYYGIVWGEILPPT